MPRKTSGAKISPPEKADTWLFYLNQAVVFVFSSINNIGGAVFVIFENKFIVLKDSSANCFFGAHWLCFKALGFNDVELFFLLNVFISLHQAGKGACFKPFSSLVLCFLICLSIVSMDLSILIYISPVTSSTR